MAPLKTLASFPGPHPASHHLQYGILAGEGLVHFLTWVTSQTGQIMRTWASCKPQNFACTHARTGARLFRVKRWQHTKALLCRSSWDSREDREFFDSEDTQQQFSCARPRSIKVFLLSFYPWRHSREEMYQALSHFTVLQVTGSWARAWEWSYENTWIMLQNMLKLGLLSS